MCIPGWVYRPGNIRIRGANCFPPGNDSILLLQHSSQDSATAGNTRHSRHGLTLLDIDMAANQLHPLCEGQPRHALQGVSHALPADKLNQVIEERPLPWAAIHTPPQTV